MTVHWAADDPDTARDDCEPVWEESHPRDVENLNDISTYQQEEP